MSKLWWSWAVVGLVACSQGAGGTPPDPNASASTAGTSSNPVSNPGPARSGRGDATLLFANGPLGNNSQAFSGPAEGASDGEDTVSCGLTSGASPALIVSFTAAGDSGAGADFALALPQLAPISEDLKYDPEQSPQALSLSVRLASNAGAIGYDYAADTSAMPPTDSSCTVVITELTERWAAGQVACRNLILESGAPEVPPPRLSATVGFDCPIQAKALPPPTGQGGTGEMGGTGGAAGSSVGGSEPGGSAGLGGTGGAPPVKTCNGVVTSCSARGYASCTDVQGCRTSGECDGISSGCYGRSQYSCSSQEGCYWSSLSKICSGSSWSCDLFSGSLGCALQDGCYWKDTCEGVATSCALFSDEPSCLEQPGCSWN